MSGEASGTARAYDQKRRDARHGVIGYERMSLHVNTRKEADDS
jgi:hypothetical protein